MQYGTIPACSLQLEACVLQPCRVFVYIEPEDERTDEDGAFSLGSKQGYAITRVSGATYSASTTLSSSAHARRYVNLYDVGQYSIGDHAGYDV